MLGDNARRFANKRAYVCLGEGGTEQVLTHAELHAAVWELGGMLHDRLPRQSRVLLLLQQDLGFVKAFLACVVAGMVAVPMYLPSNARRVARVRHIFTDADPHAVIWSSAATPNLRGNLQEQRVCEAAQWIDLDAAAGAGANNGFEPDVDADDLALLQYTSGSTGNPKGVMLCHRNLLANQEMIRDAFGHTDRSVVFACLPLYHDMGLIGNILQPLYIGATCILQPTAQVVRQPLSWLAGISRYRATTSGGPNSFYERCIRRIDEATDLRDLDLSSWRVAFNGSEAVRSATLDEFCLRFSRYGFRRSAFLPVYGLAEASLLVSGRRKGKVANVVSLDRDEYEASRVVLTGEGSSRTAVHVVSCGLPARGVEIRIHGEGGRTLEDGEIGEIVCSGESVARGYWNCDTTEVFASSGGEGNEQRFLRTADKGFLLDGELFVTGRKKELMIVGGRNYYPEDLETTVSRTVVMPSEVRNAVFSVDVPDGEGVVVVQEIAARAPAELEEMRHTIARECWLEHEVQLHDVVFVRAGTIPRTTSGKTQRLLVRQLYLDKRLSMVIAPAGARTATDAPGSDMGAGEASVVSESAARIRASLIEVIGRYFPGGKHGIDPHISLSALALDSYTVVRIAEDMGATLGIRVPLTEFVKQVTIAQLAEYLDQNRERLTMNEQGAFATQPPERELRTQATLGQVALWSRQGSAGSALTVSRAVSVNRRLEWAAFESGVARVVSLFEVLRTELREEDGKLVLSFATECNPQIGYVDARNWSDSRLAAFLEDRANSRLDIARGQSWNWLLIDRPHESIVLFVFHHIISDLETVTLLIEALFRACSARGLERCEPSESFGSYARWQRDFLRSDLSRRSGEAWVDLLRGVDLRVDIVSRKEPVEAQNAALPRNAGLRSATLSKPATAQLSRRCREMSVGLNTLLVAVLAMVSAGYTKQTAFAIGTSVSARTRAKWGRTAGYMINVLPIVVDFTEAKSLDDLVRQVGTNTLFALEHQSYPLPLIVRQYRRARSEAAHELNAMNVVFTYHRARLTDGQDGTAIAMNEAGGSPIVVGDFELQARPVRERDAEFPILMTAGLIDGALRVNLKWDMHSMYEEVMDGFFAQYVDLLNQAASADIEAMRMHGSVVSAG